MALIQTIIQAYLYDGSGNPHACPRRFYLRLVDSGDDTDFFNAQTFESGLSDRTTGLATATGILNASYQASLDGVNWTNTFVADSNPYSIGQYVNYFGQTISP